MKPHVTCISWTVVTVCKAWKHNKWSPQLIYNYNWDFYSREWGDFILALSQTATVIQWFAQVDLGFFSSPSVVPHWLPLRASFGDWLGLGRGERGFLLPSSVSLPGLSLHCLVSPAWHRWHLSIQPVMQVVCSAHLHLLGVQQFPLPLHECTHTHTHPSLQWVFTHRPQRQFLCCSERSLEPHGCFLSWFILRDPGGSGVVFACPVQLHLSANFPLSFSCLVGTKCIWGRGLLLSWTLSNYTTVVSLMGEGEGTGAPFTVSMRFLSIHSFPPCLKALLSSTWLSRWHPASWQLAMNRTEALPVLTKLTFHWS